MMQASTLQRLQEMAHAQADAEGRRVAAMQTQLNAEEQRRQELMAYERAYYHSPPITASSAQQLQEQSLFLVKLREAIAQQGQQCATYALRLQEQQRRWQAAQAKAQSLDLLAARQLTEQQQRQRRREQKEADEFAQRRRSSGGDASLD